jgi:hypothetical protein
MFPEPDALDLAPGDAPDGALDSLCIELQERSPPRKSTRVNDLCAVVHRVKMVRASEERVNSPPG